MPVRERLAEMWPTWQNQPSSQLDKSLQEGLLENEELFDYRRRQSSIQSRVLYGFIWLFKVSFVASYFLFAYYTWQYSRTNICVLGNENIFDDVPVVYEDVRFQRAGFHDTRHNVATTYEGKPDAQNDAAWDRLVDVGIITISEDENSRLTNGSASTPSNPKEHFVEIEMFHQIHCLKWLRYHFWALQNFVSEEHSSPEQARLKLPSKMDHTDHCIDYLRQALMCHGDLTPVSFEWSQEIGGYLAHHSTEHRCRNFDAIYQWAAKRKVPGMEADGNHKNVELKQPEMFDR